MVAVKRGDIVVLNIGGVVGKPRPVLIIQNDVYNQSDNLKTTIGLPLTSDLINSQLMRVRVEPSESNGLSLVSQIMIEKITFFEKSKVQSIIGKVDLTTMQEVESKLMMVCNIK